MADSSCLQAIRCVAAQVLQLNPNSTPQAPQPGAQGAHVPFCHHPDGYRIELIERSE
jgi:hypothetical protein